MIANITLADVMLGLAIGVSMFAVFLAIERWRGRL